MEEKFSLTTEGVPELLRSKPGYRLVSVELAMMGLPYDVTNLGKTPYTATL